MGSGSPSIYDAMVIRVLLFPLKLGFALGLGLAGLLLVAWTVDWVCVAYVWPERVEGLRQLLAAEIAAGMELAARQGASATSVLESADWLYALVFETNGLHEMGQRFSERGGLSVPDSVVQFVWIGSYEAIDTAILGAHLLGLRTTIVLRRIPLMALLLAVGAGEGLSQRAARRARIARESAGMYQRAKIGQLALLALGAASVLVWPTPVV